VDVEILDGHTIKITLDSKEVRFIQYECLEHCLTPKEMFEQLLGMLLIGGYSIFTGKE